MSYAALVETFAKIEDLPVPVNDVLDWIRKKTDHKDIRLYGVTRNKKAFRGAFRRLGIPNGAPYSGEYDLVCQVMYGADLPDEWKRLVIAKEAMHVFDPQGSRVNTPDAVRKLIPAVIEPDLKALQYPPAVNDYLGPFRAMAVLLPRKARTKLKASVDSEERTVKEVATLAQLPDHYVDLWLSHGDQIEPTLLRL